MKARGVPGFTLLELLVGAALALMIAGTAMGVLLSVQQVQRDAQSRNAIARDAQFAVEHLGYDLQYLGVGVPRGTSLDAVAGELRPAVRIGTSTYLAFVGDLPYPNSELNGVAVLNDIKGETTPPDSGDDDEIIVTSELSPCAPQASGATTYSCQQHLVTGLPIGATAADDCTVGPRQVAEGRQQLGVAGVHRPVGRLGAPALGDGSGRGRGRVGGRRSGGRAALRLARRDRSRALYQQRVRRRDGGAPRSRLLLARGRRRRRLPQHRPRRHQLRADASPVLGPARRSRRCGARRL